MASRQDVLDNHAVFERELARVSGLIDSAELETAAQLAHELATFAWQNSCGIFVSPALEAELARLGKQLHVTPAAPTSANGTPRVLMVMSSVYGTGGHSRIAWRTIQLDHRSRYTLVLTQQGEQPLPPQLTDLRQQGRLEIVILAQPSWCERIQALRHHLAAADQVLLLTHPNDITPCAALPGMHRPPPVIFMDHAAHAFWLGVTISCQVLSMSAILLESRRGIPKAHIGWAPLPMDFSRLDAPAAVDARAALGIPAEAVLLMSCGSDYKYQPLEGVCLADLVGPVLARHPQAHLLVVGVQPAPFWEALAQRCPGRVHLQGYLPEPELVACYQACDIYLDAVPFASPTAMFEAAACGKPVVRYAPADWRACEFTQDIETIPTSLYIWSQPAHYEQDLDRLINEPGFRAWRGQFGQRAVRLYHAEDTFVHAIEAAYERAVGMPRITVNAEAVQWQYGRLDELLAGLTRNQFHRVDGNAARHAPRLLAFYLPQFHTIPENNAWWGEGFTEWTNVRQAQPLYEGHAQPLVPGELGYYDLSSVDVMARQAELARAHGLHGFCFHYYWFDGKRLLEKPVDQLLQAPHIDLPFCLCWANENWTRRWDGGEHEILMQQSYTPALNERFARDLLPYFADARYIRIDGKPVLLVYRTDIIPDLAATVAAWRETWRSAGVGEVYLIAVESFQPIEPDAYGFDAAAEFPPHQVRPEEVAPDEPLNLIRDCDARVGDYGKLSTAWLDRPRPLYKRMRGLIPGWDNSSRRRKGGATLFVNATPAVYEDWLAQSVAHTLREFEGEERLVFINAWNEWAEGCTLEPSAALGRAHLEATRRVMQRPQQELLAAVPPQPTAYQRWLSDRPDLDTGRDTAPATTLHLQVAIAAGDPQTTAATRQSLQAQHRPADKVVSATADSSWVAALDDSAHSWTLLLAPGDTLEMDALARLEQAVAAADAAGLRLVYSDHDELDSAGRPEHPFFKPDFNHALLLSYPYVGRALLVRTAWARPLLAASGGRFDLTLAYRLALQALAENGGAAFRHVALPLLHLHPATATVFCTTSEDWQALAGVLQQHLQAQHPGAQLVEGPGPGTFHVVHPLPRTPRVSIIIPTRDQLPFLSRCVESLLAKTTYADFELLIVDNDSQTPEAREYLAGLAQLGSEQIRIVPAPGPFNFSRMNNQAARLARGELLLLLNNDTAALHEDWLSHLVRHALQDDVGIVGARLLYPDSRVQHAGVVLGLRGPAEHPCLGLEASAPAYMMRAQVQQDFSAVTAACMLVRKDLYLSLGGLDEDSFGVSYNDVDFCLRVGQSGKRVVWTPLATLLHEGSASQKRSIEASTQELKVARFTREQTAMYQRWPRLIAHDPAYNPNLSLAEHGYEIETNPLLRPQAPRTGAGRHVLAFAADTFGCGQYRVLQPLQAMMDAGLCSGGPSPEPLLPNLVLRSGADTLVFQRPNNDVALDMLEALVQLPGIRKIYEVDDNLARVPLKSAHHQEMPKDLRSRINRAIGLCDRLVVSTDALAHELAGRCGDTRVVPNRLPPAMWGSTPPRRTPAERSGRRPRVGWAGGIGHQGDLMLLAELVRDLADTVDWVFFGMCPPAIRPYVREFHPGVPTLDYPARLMQVTRDWDLAIAPLELNAFNECKSNLRLLEYGWCGLPVVCTDITPYQGSLPVTRVKNRYKDWREAILSQLQDPAASLRRGLALQQQVQADWTLTGPHLDHWYRAWTDR